MGSIVPVMVLGLGVYVCFLSLMFLCGDGCGGVLVKSVQVFSVIEWGNRVFSWVGSFLFAVHKGMWEGFRWGMLLSVVVFPSCFFLFLLVASAVALVAFASVRAVACRSVWDCWGGWGCEGVFPVCSCLFILHFRIITLQAEHSVICLLYSLFISSFSRSISRCFSLYVCLFLRHTSHWVFTFSKSF